MDLMFDRALRPVDELAILRVGHIARIATDMSMLGAFCAHVAAPLAEIGRDDLVEIDKANAGLSEIASEYAAQFDEDQRKFYDRMLGRDGNPAPETV